MSNNTEKPEPVTVETVHLFESGGNKLNVIHTESHCADFSLLQGASQENTVRILQG